MSEGNQKFMRDVFIGQIYKKMQEVKNIFFLSGDFGAPLLDKLRADFPDRFINVGIAEQNLINISVGLALEGFTVYAYGIAPFLVMRAYEQIRVNLAIFSQLREINVNLVGVGAGLSYDVSGPTHHCLEDIGIMRMLPNFSVFSPSDWVLTEKFMGYTLMHKNPKYIRLDGKPLAQIYNGHKNLKIEDGFFELYKGDDACIVSTGYMTHKAIRVRDLLLKSNINIGIIDVFLLKPFNDNLFFETLNKYKAILTIEEAFINNGGLDSLVLGLLARRRSSLRLKSIGFSDAYVFEVGSREYLHKLNNLSERHIVANIKEMLR